MDKNIDASSAVSLCAEGHILTPNAAFEEMKSVVYDQVPESQWVFRALLEQSAVGIAFIALDGRFIHVNSRFCDSVGYTSQELLETTFQAITSPEDLECTLSVAQRLLVGEIERFTSERRYARKDGSFI